MNSDPATRLNGDQLLADMTEPSAGTVSTSIEGSTASQGTNSMMTGAVAIATQTKAHVERVTEFILASVKGLRDELDELERVALDDCARLKSELDGQVVSAEAMVRQITDIKKLTQEIKSKRATLLNPRSGIGGG
jgi:hypothetical protein